MLGCTDPCAAIENMLKTQVKFTGRGDDSVLLVFEPPGEFICSGMPKSCMAIAFLPRRGGLLLALPEGFISSDAVIDDIAQEDSLFGPSKEFAAPLLEEDDNGLEVTVGVESQFTIWDVSDVGLLSLREYDAVIDPSNAADIAPFSKERPMSIIDLHAAGPDVSAWLEEAGGLSRMTFYSAREEQEKTIPTTSKAPAKKGATKKVTTAALADQVAALAAQLQLVVNQQEAMMQTAKAPTATPADVPVFGTVMPARLPPVSMGVSGSPGVDVPKALQMLGPPPRSRAPNATARQEPVIVPDVADEDPIGGAAVVSQALMQQSQAITTLVAHLAAGDPLSELSGGASSSQGLHSKGAARRERMQQELANGNSTFFLQVQQQLYKKMFPSRPLPRSDQDLHAAGATMCSYLERFGGYKGKPEMAMVMWMLSHAMDAAATENYHMVREYLALTVAAIEQSVMDGGWSVAWVLSLLEEPPVQVMSEKSTAISSLGRPFAALVPPSWSAVALAYLRELELLTSKKAEAKSPNPKSAPKTEDQPSPKRKPKFPKRPKSGGEASPQG